MIKKLLTLSLLLTVTVAFTQQSYYNDVDLTKTGVALKDELAVKITNTHTNTLSYSEAREALKVTDLEVGQNTNVLLLYGFSNNICPTNSSDDNDHRLRNKNSFGGGSSCEWNREHTFAKSLGNPNLGTSGPGADAHHLRACDTQRNSSRGSKKFSSGSGNSGSTSSGWYPGDEWKGDVARMMMYMYLRYGDRCKPTQVGIGSTANTPDSMIDLFLQWNAEDPVSDYEKQRNDYLENTSNTYGQGNRNPFIDEPYLATRIWGGPDAEDTWGLYTNSDNEAPTTPTNVVVNNATLSTLDVSWTASTDNTAVTQYVIYVDGNSFATTANTSSTLTGLAPNTTFSITITAKDAAGNESTQSTSTNGTTLQDSTPPSTPTGLIISNETGTSFKASWTAATDNVSVAKYNIYIDGTLNGNTTNTDYTASGLTNSTTYQIKISAIDTANNESAQSSPANATTTDGFNDASELFLSEYVEGSGNNKALEIANITSSSINLSGYSIKRNGNGGNSWSAPLNLSGTITAGDVYVIIHYQAADQTLIDQADLVWGDNSNNGEPINFNGNDPVGLFKNDVLIDIIGVFNGGSGNFAKNTTLRRKETVTAPNTTFDETGEWDAYSIGTVDNIGVLTGNTLSIESTLLSSFKMYPNPTKGNTLFISSQNKINIEIYNLLGKKILQKEISINQKTIDISNIKKGIYLVKISTKNKSITKKLIKR